MKKLDRPTEKRLIAFFLGDVKTLVEFYPEIGYNAAVRALVHAHCNKLRERANRSGAQDERPEQFDLDLDVSALLSEPSSGGD